MGTPMVCLALDLVGFDLSSIGFMVFHASLFCLFFLVPLLFDCKILLLARLVVLWCLFQLYLHCYYLCLFIRQLSPDALFFLGFKFILGKWHQSSGVIGDALFIMLILEALYLGKKLLVCCRLICLPQVCQQVG